MENEVQKYLDDNNSVEKIHKRVIFINLFFGLEVCIIILYH